MVLQLSTRPSHGGMLRVYDCDTARGQFFFVEADQWASGVLCQEIKHIYLSTLAATGTLDNCMFEEEVLVWFWKLEN